MHWGLASRFDLVLFQEAFVRPAQLAHYTKHAWANHPLFTEGGGGDWWPLRTICNICLSPGLLILAREQPQSVHSEPYESFAGWNSDLNKADDLFSKGFQLVQFPTFWVLNSHMDAGRGEASMRPEPSSLAKLQQALGVWFLLMHRSLSGWTRIFDRTKRNATQRFWKNFLMPMG